MNITSRYRTSETSPQSLSHESTEYVQNVNSSIEDSWHHWGSHQFVVTFALGGKIKEITNALLFLGTAKEEWVTSPRINVFGIYELFRSISTQQ